MENAVTNWSFILLFAYLSAGLLIATFIRKQVSFLRKLMIPNALLAGVIVLLLSQVFKLVEIPLEQLNITAYHLLAGVFICLGLRKPIYRRSRGVIATTVVICKSYALLALLGLAFTLVWTLFLIPDFSPAFSMLPLLGFGFDQNFASTVALYWEQLGFAWGGQAGFSFGVIGLLWAYLGGLVLVYRLRKKRGLNSAEPSRQALEGIIPRDEEQPVGGRLTTAPEGIESFALHLALIAFIFLGLFATMNQCIAWLSRFGGDAALLGEMLWSYNFVFAILLGLIARVIIDWLDIAHLFDPGLLARITGTFLDYLIVTAVAAVPLILYGSYVVEVILLSAICGLALLFFIYFLTSKMQTDYPLERTVAVFGMLTGTIAAGLALLRMADPRMESPVADELGLAGGAALLAGLPLLVLVNLPLAGSLVGQPVRYLLISAAFFAGYGILAFLIWFLYAKLSGRKAAAAETKTGA
ncbi:MAG: hypothetical protein AB1767_10350 [Bacillota bacterium]